MTSDERRSTAADQGGCVDLELLAAYADGSATPEERTRVEEHLAECGDCRAILAETAAFAAAGGAVRAPRAIPFRRRRLVTGVAAVLAVAAALVLAVRTGWLDRLTGRHSDSELTQLVAAVATEPTRPVDGRLTGGFRYAPPPVVMRGGEPREPSPDVRIAAAEIEKRARAHALSDTRALADAYLATGELDRALDLLRDAVAEHGGTAALQNDLAVCYLARAKKTASAQDAAQALSAAAAATRQAPTLAEAWFNRALALDLLGPPSAAREAWREYLRLDPNSEWAAEAKRRLTADPAGDQGANRPSSTAVAPSVALRQLEADLLPAWVSATDGAAAGTARAAAAAGAEAIARACGDPLGRDLVSELDTAIAGARGAPARLGRIAADVRAFAAARDAVEAGKPTEAAPRLASVAAGPLGREPGWALATAYWTLLVDWYRRPQSELVERAAALEPRLDARGYRLLSARTHLLHGSAHERLAHFSAAVTEYQAARSLFARLGDPDMLADTEMLLASGLLDQGDRAAAWSAERSALGRVDAVTSFNERHNVFRGAVRLLLADNLPDAALLYESRVGEEGRAERNEFAEFEAAQELAAIRLRLGDSASAARDLARATTLLARVPDPAFRDSYRVPLLLLASDVYRPGEPARAVSAATEALADIRTKRSVFLTARAYLALGRSEARDGRADAALEAWEAGIAAFEDQRPAIRDEQRRISRLSDVWDLFGDAIAALVDAGRADAALAVAEHARARALLDALSENRRAEVLTADAAERTLDRSTTVIAYSLVGPRLFTWTVRADGVAFDQRRVDRRQLRAEIGRVLRGIADGRSDLPELSDLYALLLGRQAWSPRDRVVIVPDAELWTVPFAALRDSRGRFLIEDHAVAIAPSLTLFALASRHVTPGGAPDDVLAVGDPTFDQAAHPDLPRLNGAAAEARAVAALYPHAVRLLGADATPRRMMDELPRHAVVHFAGHAVADVEFPSRSFLLLAGGGDAGRLEPAAISAARTGRARLVVLAACSTAAGPIAAGEGAASLARPFLAAGVPQVVGALWPVDDRSALLVRFHRGLAAGEPAAEALRAAQRDALAHGAAVGEWAGYELIGGMAPRRDR